MKRNLLLSALVLGLLFTAGCAGERQQLKEADALYQAGDYAAAVEILSALEDSEAGATLLAACETALSQQAYDAALGALEAGDYGVAQTAFLQLGDFLDAPEQAEEARMLELEQGAQALAERVLTLSAGQEDPFLRMPQLLAELEPLSQHPRAAQLMEALTALNQRDGNRLTALLADQQAPLVEPAQWAELLTACLPYALQDGDGALSLLAALKRLTQPEMDEDAQLQILTLGEAPLHAPAKQVLDRAGKAPAGRILIYATRRHYASEDQAYYDLNRMEKLPASLLAAGPEEADYIIHIAYDYKRVGRFTTYYNRGVLEYADVILLDAATGKRIGAIEEVLGPTAKSLETAKITSEFVSGGPPDEEKIDLAVTKALQRALELLTEGETP